ncbi:MAG: hypothetical protein AAB432_03415 [Patescibacteria group bacterium]
MQKVIATFFVISIIVLIILMNLVREEGNIGSCDISKIKTNSLKLGVRSYEGRQDQKLINLEDFYSRNYDSVWVCGVGGMIIFEGKENNKERFYASLLPATVFNKITKMNLSNDRGKLNVTLDTDTAIILLTSFLVGLTITVCELLVSAIGIYVRRQKKN